RHISDRVGVMYLGRIVEIGTDAQIYDHPTHPYTQALLSAVPVPDPEARAHRERIILTGDVPSPANIPSGCRFRTRCWKARERCAQEVPLLAVPAVFRLTDSPARHDSACHFAEEKHVVAEEHRAVLEKGDPGEDGTPDLEKRPGPPPPGGSHLLRPEDDTPPPNTP
ncbi:oligopeptide/dipeptide ABC transporter ATP-binding protein, partial [Streptomyces cinereoruber]